LNFQTVEVCKVLQHSKTAVSLLLWNCWSVKCLSVCATTFMNGTVIHWWCRHSGCFCFFA